MSLTQGYLRDTTLAAPDGRALPGRPLAPTCGPVSINNRGIQQIRKWLYAGLAINGVKSEDVPSDVEL